MRRPIALALVVGLTLAFTPPAAEAHHGHVVVGIGAAVGLVLVAPMALCLFLTTIVLALLTRAAPQLNIYTVGFPLRMLVGLGSLLLFLPQLMAGLGRMLAHFSDMLARMV